VHAACARLGWLGLGTEASPPADFWLRVVLITAVVLAVIGLLRALHRFSKTLYWLVLGCLLSVFAYNWVWQRQEPPWATPVVERVAGWLGRPGSLALKE
jgi:hypothetical protein